VQSDISSSRLVAAFPNAAKSSTTMDCTRLLASYRTRTTMPVFQPVAAPQWHLARRALWPRHEQNTQRSGSPVHLPTDSIDARNYSFMQKMTRYCSHSPALPWAGLVCWAKIAVIFGFPRILTMVSCYEQVCCAQLEGMMCARAAGQRSKFPAGHPARLRPGQILTLHLAILILCLRA
jgi:hypothetical protein